MTKPSSTQQSLSPLGGPPVSRPEAIDTAFRLTIAGLVFGVVGTVITTLADHEQIVLMIRATLTRTGEPFTEDDVVGLIGVYRIAGGVVLALVAALVVLLAFRMRAGRNWARLLLTLITLLDMVSFLSAVSSTGAALELIWNLAGVAFAGAAVIYMFRPESMTYFAERGKRR